MTTSSYVLKRPRAESSASIFKILSNKNRYAILKIILLVRGDLCVHELSEAVGISQSATSHQLAYLEARGVVRGVRMGKTRCYEPTENPITKKITKIIKLLK